MKYHDYPTVELRTLASDHNFHDKVFENFVARWMTANMPGFPMGLLDTDSEAALERWQIEPDIHHKVEAHDIKSFECENCGEKAYNHLQEDCCDSPNHQEACETLYLVRNTDTGEHLANQRYIRRESLEEDLGDLLVDGEEVLAWETESEAQKAADTADTLYSSENEGYGFPWAHSWVFLPDRYVSTQSLKQAGFKVATYIGGQGRVREDDQYRLAGIDGGGYSFAATHFARLVAVHCETRDIPVDTANGPVYITTDYRADLEKLRDAV